MFGRISKICISICLSLVVVISGCRTFKLPTIKFGSAAHKTLQDPLAYGPDVNAIAVYNDYAPGAVRATGGYQSWIETVKLELDCLVTFYKPDGSFYVTEQKHRIYPWSNSIAISADEPRGKFSCLLSRARVAKGQPAPAAQFERQGAALPLEYLSERDLAEGVLELMTAPARLLDTQAVFSKGPQPVRIDGLWYDTVERFDKLTTGRTPASGEVSLYKAVFYQNRQNSQVVLIRYSDASAGGFDKLTTGKFFTVRGYGYKKINNGGVSVPRKIDIFRTDVAGVQQQLLASISYNLP